MSLIRLITLSSILFISSCDNYSQKASEQHNLGFEVLDGFIAKGWNKFGDIDNYSLELDSELSFSGSRSGAIHFTGKKAGFAAWSYAFPAEYQGTKITLRGSVKTEGVSEGWAGLWMRIDPNVSFDNMRDRGVTGTTDWKQYEITLDLKPSNAKQIVVGGLLAGRGHMWLDNLEIFIDGVPINDVQKVIKKSAQAVKDNEFDSGSNVSFGDLDKTKIENLNLLGKVWGFLKYYHPEIAAGRYNWDYELFRLLPNFLRAQTVEERDKRLINWIESLGIVEQCDSCKASTGAVFPPDLNWFSDISSPELKLALNHIYQNRNQGEHYYLDKQAASNPLFRNEDDYSHMPFPDAGFRLLAVYRYWNMIHYFFPYKHLIDEDWNDVLPKYIELFLNAQNELEYEVAALHLISEINDSHAKIWSGNDKFTSSRGDFVSPLHVRFIENELVVTDFYIDDLDDSSKMAEFLGINVGDVITRINGEKVQDILHEQLPLFPGSNLSARLRDMAPELLRSNTESIPIEIKKNGIVKQHILKLFKPSELSVFRWYRRNTSESSYKMLDNNIGYITLANIKSEDVDAIKSAFKNTTGIIIDIRNYPNTFVPFSLGSFFVDKETPFAKFTELNLQHPGEFNFFGPVIIPSSGPAYKGKVIVLVNELTQSQAEYTTMAFQAGLNTLVIGSQTAGADGNISKLSLPGGLITSISGIGVYYPDGTETQRVGIVPDIEVHPTIQGIKLGEDELLQRAIKEILGINN